MPTTSVPRRRNRASEGARIREVFLQPQALYETADAARLLGLSEPEIRRRIGDGSIEAVARDGEQLVAWQELLGAGAAERWTPRSVAEALPPRIVPRLARSARGTIVLPLYVWKVLRIVARELSAEEDRELNASDLVERAVHRHYVEEIRDWRAFEERVPGIHAAAVWPAMDALATRESERGGAPPHSMGGP